MNHLPFEDWLLDDQPLSVEQERELQSHLKLCNSCTSIARANLAMHSRVFASPSQGFSGRFHVRLAEQRHKQKVQQIIGSMVLMIGGLVLFVWLSGPLFVEAVRSPAQWLTTGVSYTLFILTSVQVLGEIGSILLRVLPAMLPPGEWLTLFLLASGLGYIGFVSVERVRGITQGA